MDIENSSFLLSEVGSQWIFPPTDQTVLPVAVSQGHKLRVGAAYMKSRASLQSELQAVSVRQSLTQHYGILNDEHGLSKQSQPLGIRASEPQVTGGIAHYLRADGDQQASRKRIEVFLLALLRGREPLANLSYDLRHFDQASGIKVAAEYPLANGRKIDLLIQWNMPGEKPCVVAIEAKFGHQVTVGQLPDYRKQVMRLANGGYYAMVLLTLDGQRSSLNKQWIPQTWRTVLTRWEKIPAPDDDESFALIKRMIWDRL